MDTQVEAVKQRTDIVEYIGSFMELKKAGRHYKGLCPFHQEKSASFVVSPDRQMWYCFGACHEGGDVISFAMKMEHITFYEALKDLAVKAGIQLDTVSFEDKEWTQKERLLKINALATQFFEYILHNTSYGAAGLEYLKGRHLPVPMMKKFRLGYAPRSWDSLLRFLKKKGYKDQDLYEAGLVVRNDSGRVYDRFRGRVMFPIFDIRGDIIGFSGRILESSQEAKYVNTPETHIYHKRESLYGIQIAKDAIRKLGNVLLVEGEFDMICPYIQGIEHIVAIKGSVVTREQLHILKRLTKRITLALDADAAGEEATRRGIEEAERQEFEVHIVPMDTAKDPADIVSQDPVHFKKMLQSPIPIYDFLITLAQKKYPEQNAFAKKNIADFVGPYIFRITNPIVQSHYMKKLALLLEVDEISIAQLMKQFRAKQQERRFKGMKPSENTTNRDELMQKYLISRIFQHEQPYMFADAVFSHLKVDDFTIPSLQKVSSAFLSYKNGHTDYDSQQFVATLPSELQRVYDELYLFSSTDSEFHKENIEKLVLEVKRNLLKKQISTLLVSEMDEQAKEEKISSVNQSLKEVEIKIQSL